VTLGREMNGFDPGAGFFDAICQDPELAHLKLIAEPWDVGQGGYNLGRFPAAFSEWNDRFRDGLRRYWRGDPAMRSDVAARLARSMLTSLLTALGTPMLLSGDEYGRTQQGNNNAYCQDNDLSWFDWRAARSHEGRALTDFAGRLAGLRRTYPTLRCSQYLGG